MNSVKVYFCPSMARTSLFLIALILLPAFVWAQTLVTDDFEGNGTITTWFGDDCGINTALSNPFQQTINTSATVLEYHDTGGQFANVRFDVSENFDLSSNHTFSLKLFVPSSGITGNQTNQISLKLQDGTLGAPWVTQSEIIKPILIDQWQTISFDFLNDTYMNLDPGSPAPTQRNDFNRVVIQINGENNNDQVLAYLDDIVYDGTLAEDPVFDELVWSDEFDDNGAINNAKWFHQTQLPNGTSWFNGEIQHYTNRIDNAVVENGLLKIIAKKENFTDQGVTKNYTSARLNSKFTFTYGKVEIRAKLPSGVGTWPAMWMLGKNINETGAYWQTQGFGNTPWPDCGEIDILEHWGANQNFVQSAIHSPSSFGNTSNLGGQVISTASTDFHIYALEWSAEKMVFSVDGTIHYTYNPAIKDSNTWPFDAEQYILLNVAILPNIASNFSSSNLEIDYVRVYQQSTLSNTAFSNSRDTLVYPNPVKDVLRIHAPNSLGRMAQLKIYNIEGKPLKTFDRPVQNNHIVLNDLDFLPAGLYFLSMEVDQKKQVLKFIKQ